MSNYRTNHLTQDPNTKRVYLDGTEIFLLPDWEVIQGDRGLFIAKLEVHVDGPIEDLPEQGLSGNPSPAPKAPKPMPCHVSNPNLNADRMIGMLYMQIIAGDPITVQGWNAAITEAGG